MKKILSIFALVIGAVALAACGNSPTVSGMLDVPAGSSPSDIRDMLAGNTLIDAAGRIEYHHPDGYTAYFDPLLGEDAVAGAYYEKGSEQMCYVYPSTGDSPESCWTFRQTSNGTLIQQASGTQIEFLLLEGDKTGISRELSSRQIAAAKRARP